MELIEPGERRDFEAVLARHNLDANDFEFNEIDTTDPKTDEILALTGTLAITRKSTGRQREYPIGDCSSWVAEFQRDLDNGDFN